MPRKQTERGNFSRAYSLAFELVCTVAGFALVGAWVDRHFDKGPWGVLIGLGLGAVGGFYNLFRGASRTLQSGTKRAVPSSSSPRAGAVEETAKAGSDGTDRLDS